MISLGETRGVIRGECRFWGEGELGSDKKKQFACAKKNFSSVSARHFIAERNVFLVILMAMKGTGQQHPTDGTSGTEGAGRGLMRKIAARSVTVHDSPGRK